jgi:hypothetical protein
VELTAPPEKKPTETELSEPICPAGVVSPPSAGVDEGFEEPPAPGASPLDEGLEELRSALGGLADEEGGDA